MTSRPDSSALASVSSVSCLVVPLSVDRRSVSNRVARHEEFLRLGSFSEHKERSIRRHCCERERSRTRASGGSYLEDNKKKTTTDELIKIAP